MPITWDADDQTFHLHDGRLSYLIRVLDNGTLGHLHFGGPLALGRPYSHLVGREFLGFDNRLGDPVALEYPSIGIGDYRIPALVVEQADGSTALDLRYAGHRILPGKPALPGLPSTYVEADEEADTLEILLVDEPAALEVRLLYSLFAGRSAIARSARLRNAGRSRLTIRSAMSLSQDLPDGDWEMLQLSGSWARERHVRARHLEAGSQSVGSLRGTSSHQHNPFVALVRPWTTEDQGEAYAFSLVYSGNFLAEAEVDAFSTARLRLGIHPQGFSWALEPGDEFQTPEAIAVYSDHGLEGISDALHGLLRDRLARGRWRDERRPVLLNSWEATYFDFDEDHLLGLAVAAQELGIELFVLDDGWFGERTDDTSSLGDWVVNRAKLPGGIDGLAATIESLGLRFGLWIEPEMVSARSGLFARHPDWAVGIPSRPRTESRHQYVLDMARPEVVEHLFEVLSGLLRGSRISYVKWDMNRTITEPFSATLPVDRQGEFFHRYVLGVYALYDRLTKAFPDVLFESCAGGGGRFDPGLLAYAPQAWTSDDTDAVERLRIQWGTSLAYPLSAMAAHVSNVPNHQVGRTTPLATRAAVAFFGVLGYELDLLHLSETERQEVAAQIVWYRERWELFQRGRFLRLRSPFEGDGNETAWMVVDPGRQHAVVGHYRVLNRPHPGPGRLRLRGLDGGAVYRVTPWPDARDAVAQANAGRRGGDELMQVGLVVQSEDAAESRLEGDFRARLFELEAEGAASKPVNGGSGDG